MNGVDVIRHLHPQLAVFIQRCQAHFARVLSLAAVVVIVVTTQNHVLARKGHSRHPFPDVVVPKIHHADFRTRLDHHPQSRGPVLPLDFLNRDPRATGLRNDARVEINCNATVVSGKPNQVSASLAQTGDKSDAKRRRRHQGGIEDNVRRQNDGPN